MVADVNETHNVIPSLEFKTWTTKLNPRVNIIAQIRWNISNQKRFGCLNNHFQSQQPKRCWFKMFHLIWDIIILLYCSNPLRTLQNWICCCKLVVTFIPNWQEHNFYRCTQILFLRNQTFTQQQISTTNSRFHHYTIRQDVFNRRLVYMWLERPPRSR